MDSVIAEDRQIALEGLARCAVLNETVTYRVRTRFDGKLITWKIQMEPLHLGPVVSLAIAWEIPAQKELLTPRERDAVIALIEAGGNAKKAARKMCVSTSTVESHRVRIYRKLGVSDPVALCRFAIRAGMLEP